MKLVHHYRTLGLRRNASFIDVKKAYRQLVRQCHPDINPDEAANERFIQINVAYTALCEALQQDGKNDTNTGQSGDGATDRTASTDDSKPPERLNLRDLKRTLEKLGLGNFQQESAPVSAKETPAKASTETVTTSPVSSQTAPSTEFVTDAPGQSPSSEAEPLEVEEVTSADIGLKQEAYDQLRDLLRQQKFPRAIALVEGLAHRLPTDTEINQWQAIVYQRWGRQLISQGQFHKAHLYLKKALQTDPNNPSLSNEVARDLGLLKHIQAAEATLSQP